MLYKKNNIHNFNLERTIDIIHKIKQYCKSDSDPKYLNNNLCIESVGKLFSCLSAKKT